MKSKTSSFLANRRAFIRSMLVAGLAPQFIPSRVLGEDAPSKKVTLGFIGVGTHGYGYNLKRFLSEKDCRAVAVCDVQPAHRERAKSAVNKKYGNEDCRTFSDFREVLGRADIDAVVISTPDHWHVPMSLLALKAGKQVFCEKPTLTIAEGRELVGAVKKSGLVFATGLEDRAVPEYHRLAELVRNGAIGKLEKIQVGLPVKPIFKKEDPAPVPEGLDYDLWLGPAPFRPYFPSLTKAQCWRQIRDFSGGSLTDWGAHLIDTAQVANFAEWSGPVAVKGRGEIPPDTVNSVPRTYEITYTYANGVTLEVKSSKPSIRLEGSKGWIGNSGWRGKIKASDQAILERSYEEGSSKIWPRPPFEHRNFLDVILSGKKPIYSAEGLHRLSTVMHVGAISMELERSLKWDPKAESFDDKEANALRSRERRKPWV